MVSTYMSYQLVSKNLPKSLAQTSRSPQVAREQAYYLANIEKIKNIDDFLGNQRVFAFAMKAFGLEDMTYAKAFMRKVLEGGIDSKTAFANKLTDQRYKSFVATFNFARYGDTTTVFEATRQGTVDRYVQQTLEQNAGAQNDAVRLALYFQRQAPSLKSTYGILADPALLKVVQTALSLPSSTSFLPIEKQAAMIEQKLNISDFQDPVKLQKFINGFAIKWDISQAQTTSSPLVSLLQTPSARNAPIAFNYNLLLTLQTAKFKG